MTEPLYWCTLGNHPTKGGFSQNLGFIPFLATDVLGCCYFEYKPKQLIGFPSAKERDQMQRTLLTAPISAVRKALDDLQPRVASGEVVVIDVDVN